MIKTNAFADPTLPSLADLRIRVLQDPALDRAQRTAFVSALNKTAAWLELDAGAIPAAHPYLRQRFQHFHPAKAGVSKKRYANVRSLLNAALARYGCGGLRTHLAPFSPACRRLYDALPGKYERCALSRLLRFLSAQGLDPQAMSDGVAAAFLAALEAESLIKNPREAHKNALRAWNRMVDRLPDWPPIRLTEPCYRDVWGLPWSAFPPALEAETDAFFTYRASEDLFAEDGPDRPLSPRTIATQKDHVRCFASALVRRGHPVTAITGLGYLVAPAQYQDGLLWWYERQNQRVNGYLGQIAYTLKKIAKYGVRLPAAELDAVERAYRKVAGRAEPGGAVSRARLKQFDSPRACRRFLAFPARQIESVLRHDRGGIEDALAIQWAIGLELWLFAPLRLTNFVGLRLDEHLFWPNGERPGPLLISVHAPEVKNREALEFEIPAEIAAHVRLYLDRFRPRLVCGANPWLFPGETGGPKHVATWRHQIQRAVREATGLEIHPHLIRRIGPKLFLERHPEMKPIIQHLLGHRKAQTTELYLGPERKAALRLFNATILGLCRDARDPEDGR